jgi:hypothetical protein
MGNLNYKIIDNFLEKDVFDNFKKIIFSSENIPWYYKYGQTNESSNSEEDIGFFSLCFFSNFKEDFVFLNNFLHLIYTKLNCRSLIKSKANLTLRGNNKNKLFFHTDYPYNSYTAIFYLNTNNGATILDEKKQIEINSIENRILIFDANINHAVKVQTDEKRRIVLNINYF